MANKKAKAPKKSSPTQIIFAGILAIGFGGFVAFDQGIIGGEEEVSFGKRSARNQGAPETRQSPLRTYLRAQDLFRQMIRVSLQRSLPMWLLRRESQQRKI